MTSSDSTSQLPTTEHPRHGQLAVIVPWILVALLIISNGATLLNERANTAAHGLLATIASIAGDSAAHALLARSPTQTRINAIDQATRNLKAQNADLDARHRSLQSDNTKLQTSKAALAKERDALQAFKSKQAAAVKSLATRTTAKLATRSSEAVTYLPVRAAPYIGIAALVSFTAAEIISDCELAKSLADLNKAYENEQIDTGEVCRFTNNVPTKEQVWDSVKKQASATQQKIYQLIEKAMPASGSAIKAAK